MTANNNWPDKPGVPLNPERDGWHWLETPDGERVPYEWRSAGECERGRWPSYWVSQGEDCWEAPTCKYLAPVLTPEEEAALQKRVAELETALKAAAEDIGDWGAYASQYLQEKWDLSGEVKRYTAISEGKLPYRARYSMEEPKDE